MIWHHQSHVTFLLVEKMFGSVLKSVEGRQTCEFLVLVFDKAGFVWCEVHFLSKSPPNLGLIPTSCQETNWSTPTQVTTMGAEHSHVSKQGVKEKNFQ